MKTRRLLLALLSLIPLQAGAAQGGIESANYSLGVAVTDSEWYRDYTLSGTARLPLVDYVGLTLGAGLGTLEESDKSKEQWREWGLSVSSDTTYTEANLGIVVSDFTIGKVSADYSRSDYESTTTFGNTPIGNVTYHDHWYYNTYQLSGSYYFNRFDLGATRGWSKSYSDDSSSKSNGTLFDVGYYPTDNLLAGLRTDADTEVYELSLMYQPQLFNNAIGLGFSMTDSIDSDDIGRPYYSLNLAYYFGTRVSLIDRKRRY
ncbi:MAG TPA: hypothetical protein VGE50_06330 [Gammaproteobacteria bacterium]